MSAAERLHTTDAYVLDRARRGLPARVTSRDLREDYEAWAASRGVEPLSRRPFCSDLRLLGWTEFSTGTERGWTAPEAANDNAEPVVEVPTVRVGKPGDDDVVMLFGMWQVPQRGWRSCAIPIVREDAERLGALAVPDLRTIAMRQITDQLWRVK
jgi:hypothetical protein